jgi:hypothetical protein
LSNAGVANIDGGVTFQAFCSAGEGFSAHPGTKCSLWERGSFGAKHAKQTKLESESLSFIPTGLSFKPFSQHPSMNDTAGEFNIKILELDAF